MVEQTGLTYDFAIGSRFAEYLSTLPGLPKIRAKERFYVYAPLSR